MGDFQTYQKTITYVNFFILMKHTKQRIYWTPELEKQVKDLRETGSSVEFIARETGISLGNVYAFLKKHNISARELAVVKKPPKTGKYAHLK